MSKTNAKKSDDMKKSLRLLFDVYKEMSKESVMNLGVY